MATTIARNFSEINKLIKEIKTSASAAAKEGGALDRALKIDPTNFDTAAKKLENLNKRFAQSKVDLDAMRKAQRQLISEGKDINASEYQNLNNQIITTEASQKKLTQEIKAMNKEFAGGSFNKTGVALSKVSDGLDKMKQKVQGVSRAAKAALATIAAMATAYIKLGDELSDTSTKLNTSVESLQIGRGVYENFADGADGYDQSLKALGATMNTIARGRGKAYMDALQGIGIAYEDLLGKDTSTQLDMVTAALAKIEDPVLRTEKAMTIMNEAGRNTAAVAGLTAEELNKYKSALSEAGLITTEQAKLADEAANKIALIKQQTLVTSAALIEQLMPIIMELFNFIQQNILPMLKNLFTWFGNLSDGSKRFILIAITMIAVLPTLIGIIKGVVMVVKVVNAALLLLPINPVVATIIAIVVAIGLLIAAFFALKKALGMGGGNNPFQAQIENLTSMQSSASSVTEVKKTEDLNLNLSVEVSSDQPISETIAKQISDDVVKYVNAQLAKKVQAR